MPGWYGLASHASTASTPDAALPPSYPSMGVEERVVRVDTFSKLMGKGGGNVRPILRVRAHALVRPHARRRAQARHA